MSEYDEDDYLWNPRATPDPEVVRFEIALRGVRWQKGKTRVRRSRQVRWPLMALAAGLLLVVALATSRRITAPWAVVMMRNTPGLVPILSARPPLTAGNWIVTDDSTRARLNVGALGKADIGPSSRIRLVRASIAEHRLELAEGILHARIWAPPRFFLVETVSALAVDLGCVYTLQIDRLGTGYLRVESGEVELVGRRFSVRVPAGNTVHMNRASGPGLPFPDDASPAFISALKKIEEASEGPPTSQEIAALLREVTPRTTITMWHLLPRVSGAQRAEIATRMIGIAPLPAGLSLPQVIRLEPRAMESWRSSLEEGWSTEKGYFWKRWWKSLWRGKTPVEKLPGQG